MNGNEKRKIIKREQILLAAQQLLIAQGYRKTSIAQIAKQAQASQVTLYKYFSSKVELAREVVVKLIVDGYAQYFKKLDDSSMTFMKKVESMTEDSVSMSGEMNNDFFEFMVAEFQGKNGDTRVMDEYQSLKFKFWKTLLDQGRAEHVISDEITDQGALIYLDMYVGYVMSPDGASYKNAREMKKHAKELVHMFFYGILGK
ncbi:TetR/AcrR family transcriptional regulator [Companilactobacillus furfuricola]|uniref:TetR/AcrR family transcriptional regulator n=1 Tax=Companilactobacillus furfuricola TaxID=1462575 RepID=UPI000F7A3385|nr:TetR/AcrR family transcriptional regulator [Companilactobacillus furfuricola]